MSGDLVARGRLPRPFSHVIAVLDGPNPSWDYYLAERMRAAGVPLHMAGLYETPPQRSFDGALLLFCRYAVPRWLCAVEAQRRRLAGVALFLDDDLHALRADPGVPAMQRLRYWWQGPAQWRRLSAQLDLLLVSTPELTRRYAAAQPLLLPPLIAAQDGAPCAGTPRVAYHASPIHRGEHHWLMPLANELRAAAPQLPFEVTARGATAAAWRRYPGVEVRPFLPWPQYRQAGAAHGIGLMLAPTLPTRANAARCWTKRLDAARAGAALLVSDPALYRVDAREAALGMRVPLRLEAWRDAVLELAADGGRLRALARLNQERVRELQAAAPLLQAAGPGLWRIADLARDQESATSVTHSVRPGALAPAC